MDFTQSTLFRLNLPTNERLTHEGRLKWCQKKQEQIKMDKIAEMRANKNFGKFWKATGKLNTDRDLPASAPLECRC